MDSFADYSLDASLERGSFVESKPQQSKKMVYCSFGFEYLSHLGNHLYFLFQQEEKSMNIYEAIEKRRSVRVYREEPIPEESLKRILEAGRLAPSAHNSQDYKFIVVKDAKKRKALAKAALEQRFVAQAPVIIVAVSLNPEHLLASGVPAYAFDLAIALDHMTLAAVEENLGTCWIGAFEQKEVKKILNIPPQYKVAALLPLGYPDDEPSPKSRKKIETLVCYEDFSE